MKLPTLYQAVTSQSTESVRDILSPKKYLNESFGTFDETPLHAAAKQGDPEIFQLLLDAGANFDAVDSRGYTPAHLAASHGSIAVWKLLTVWNADLNAKNYYGHTPLHLMARNNIPEEDAKVILSTCNLDVNAVNTIGNTPLHVAASKGNAKISKLLIDQGAYVNPKNQDKLTPLQRAILSGPHLDVVKLLMDEGADLGSQDDLGNSLLHLAVDMRDFKVARVLLDAGAKVNAKNLQGHTPVHLAIILENFDMMKLLMDSGAEVDAKDLVFKSREEKKVGTAKVEKIESECKETSWDKMERKMDEICEENRSLNKIIRGLEAKLDKLLKMK